MMTRLPVPVSDKDIDDMFAAADRNKDGKITYREFQVRFSFSQYKVLKVAVEVILDKRQTKITFLSSKL